MTGELLQRVKTADGTAYECAVCGGQSSTRLPNHDLDCLSCDEGESATVHNRAAVIERVYEDVVRVRYEDTDSLDYVDHDAVEVQA